MRVERRAAIRELLRELFRIRASAVATTERIVAVLPSGEAWHAVYRFDGPGLGCWDFFPQSRNPDSYDLMVSDQLRTTREVVALVRRMIG